MNKSSTRGIFLSITLLFSIMLITIPSIAYGEEIIVKSIALEETTVLELKNDSDNDVNSLRIWLGSDVSFKSFKTEKGWIGERTPQGVIIFTSSESIKSGESVKFGVKTDKPNPGINWKALDSKNTQMGSGMSIATKIPTLVEEPKSNEIIEDVSESMSTKSTFRIIPDKPNVGSTIRVTGDSFDASQEFDFYIDNKKIGTFETDERGHFMATMKIPDNLKADRVDFKVKDKEGEEKKVSLRVGEVDNRIPVSTDIPLTIKGIPNIIHRGDFLEIYGTGNPNSAITAEINTPDGKVVNSRTAEIDSKGNWKLDEPILVELDTPFGKYSAKITDGRSNKLVYWTVESDKKISMISTSSKYEQGELLKFNGTALPNKTIEIVLKDPLGKEIVSDILQIDNSGVVEYEFQTTQITPEGTYTLIATQEKEKEFIYVGIGQLPVIPVNLEFDKLNYKKGETAKITITGKASEIISLLIINPSDKPVEKPISITLQPDGRGSHFIDLNGYSSGVYTAVISKGSAQSEEIFTVGLQTGSGEIEINTTKTDYHPGDSILILGETGSNVLLTLTMTDTDGNVIKVKETFSDKNRKISESSFRIPSDATPGTWTINAQSGPNFDNIEIEVLRTALNGMLVSVTFSPKLDGVNNFINIHVIGAAHTVEIEIIAADGEIIQELSFPSSKEGEINQPWKIPKETESGTYTIRVTDAFSSAESTFVIQ